MPGCARPVRIFCSSVLNDSIERAILASAVFLMSAIVTSRSPEKSDVHQRAFVLALHHALEGAGLEDAEHADGQLLVAAQGERGGIQHLQVLRDGLVERHPRVAGG